MSTSTKKIRNHIIADFNRPIYHQNDNQALLNIRLNEMATAITTLSQEVRHIKAVVNHMNRRLNLGFAMK